MEPVPATRQPLHLNAPFLGIGLLVSWSTAFVRSKGMGISASQANMHTLFYTFLAIALVCMLARWLIHRRSPRNAATPSQRPTIPLMCAMLMTLATLVNARPSLFPGIGENILSMGAAVTGSFGYGILLVRWGALYASLEDSDGLRNGLAAFSLHALANLTLGIVPEGVKVLLVALLPWLSAAGMILGSRQAHAAPVGGRRYQLRDLASLWKISLGIVAYALLLGMRSRVNIQISDPALTACVQLMACFCYMGLLAWLLTDHAMPSFTRCFQILLIVFATGFLLYPFSGGEGQEAVAGIFSLGVGLIFTLMWLASVDLARHTEGLDRRIVVAFVWLLYSAPRPLGAALANALFAEPAGAYALSLAMTYCVVMASAFLLGSQPAGIRRIFEKPDDPSTQPSEPLLERCDQVAAAHNLTEREKDIMFLLCQGRTKVYIAETLRISENTVKSYARNVYTKLDVHSINELIDVVRG